MATVLLLLDALRHDYVNEIDTPFLYKCSKQGEYYKKVIPSYGFCERSEILTGEKPNKTGFFTAIGYDPRESPYKDIKYVPLLKFIEQFIPKNLRVPGKEHPGGVNRLYRRFLRKVLSGDKYGMGVYNIPVEFLSKFSLTEDKIDHRNPNAFCVPSILSLLKEKRGSYNYDSFSALNLPLNGNDDDRLEKVLDAAKNKPSDLYLIYISTPDSIGHQFGPNSVELKQALTRMDYSLSKFTNEFEHACPNTTYVYLGDHGMLPVESTFDVKREIDILLMGQNLIAGKDYVYFLDSTMVRFWFNSQIARDILEVKLRSHVKFLSNGNFLDNHFLENESLPVNDSRYGDLIWLANPGVLVFPDFFHQSSPSKGMHGYNPKLPESQGTCIVYGTTVKQRTIESIALTSVFDILKHHLNL